MAKLGKPQTQSIPTDCRACPRLKAAIVAPWWTIRGDSWCLSRSIRIPMVESGSIEKTGRIPTIPDIAPAIATFNHGTSFHFGQWLRIFHAMFGLAISIEHHIAGRVVDRNICAYYISLTTTEMLTGGNPPTHRRAWRPNGENPKMQIVLEIF